MRPPVRHGQLRFTLLCHLAEKFVPAYVLLCHAWKQSRGGCSSLWRNKKAFWRSWTTPSICQKSCAFWSYCHLGRQHWLRDVRGCKENTNAQVFFFFFSGPLYILLSFIIEIERSSLEIATDCSGYKYNGFTTYFPSLDNSVCNLSGVASFGDAGSVFARNTTIFVLQCK